jgi:hypothetical protein
MATGYQLFAAGCRRISQLPTIGAGAVKPAMCEKSQLFRRPLSSGLRWRLVHLRKLNAFNFIYAAQRSHAPEYRRQAAQQRNGVIRRLANSESVFMPHAGTVISIFWRQ